MKNLPLACLALVVAALGADVAAARGPCASMALKRAMLDGGHALSDPRWGVLGERPDSAAFVDSDSFPVRVHQGNGADLEDTARVLAAVEAAWQRQVVERGWDPPRRDGSRGGSGALDVYVMTLPPDVGAVTFAELDRDQMGDGRAAVPASIRIDPALSGDLLQVFVDHELNHALQYAMDAQESVFLAEATSTLQEILAVPTSTAWIDALPAFQRHPQAPIFTHSADWTRFTDDDDNRYEYGGVLFLLWLQAERGGDAFDDDLVQDLWRGSIQPEAKGGGGLSTAFNEPDWLDAFEDVAGLSVADAVLDFATWRFLIGLYEVDDDGPPLSLPNTSAVAAAVIVPEGLDGTPDVTLEDEGPFQYGCLLRQIPGTVDETVAVTVEATANRSDQTLGLAFLRFQPQNGPTPPRALRTVSDQRGARVVDEALLLPGETLLFAVCDLGPADGDERAASRPITWSARRADLAPPSDAGVIVDAGTDDVAPPDDAPSCGCQSAGDPTSSRRFVVVLGLLLAVATITRAVRRMVKQRGLKKKSVMPKLPPRRGASG
jgi:MYXO-CTERM domain-containing protein